MSCHPKVFISYSHDDESHRNWVLKLATHLRSRGVDVIFDQWDLRLGYDLPMFMEQGLSSSSLVVCICSSLYVEKADIGKGGVGYEKKILSANLVDNAKLNYVIPLIRNNIKEKLPVFLSGSLYINFNDDDKYYDSYRKLLERIYDEDIKKKPSLGENPFQNNDVSQEISLNLALDKIKYINPLFEGRVLFDYKSNNGIYTIGEGDFSFVTAWSERGNNSIYCYKDKVKRIGYNSNYREFPLFDEIRFFDFSSRTRSINVGEVVVLENRFNNFVAIKVKKIICKNECSNHLLEFEYKIYYSNSLVE